ncbi:unnamed protein product [Knipowitschia caucasica]|uniref:Sushi domain-containing protein n=1 Tax=Knipowitschia caucasica TaxID=637954 RepID=A0AAV2LZP5_KNICA
MKTFSRIIALFSCAFLSTADGSGCASKPPDFPYAKLMSYTADKALYKCVDGYVPSAGSRVRTCTGGVWSEMSLRCEQKSCGSAGELVNGHIKYDGEPVLGAKAFPICDTGFTLKGPESIECGSAGWPTDHGLVLTCEVSVSAVAVMCPAPEVANSVKKGVTHDYKVGAMVTVACSAGFEARGERNVKCGDDGQWQPPLPQCVPRAATTKAAVAAMCPAPEVANSVKKGVTHDYKVGAMVTVACSAGFEARGERNVKCGDDGQWQPPLPQCVPRAATTSRCGVPETPRGSNVQLAPKFFSIESFAAGAKVYYLCGVGHVRDQGSKYRKCIRGQWSPLELQCRRRLCGSAGEIHNGRYIYTGVEFGDIATAKCDSGFQLVGQATRNCLSRGWDGHDPLCEELSCEDPPEVPNAEVVGFAEAPYSPRTVVTYRCQVGVLIGPSDIWCTDNGTWSSPLPQCKVWNGYRRG